MSQLDLKTFINCKKLNPAHFGQTMNSSGNELLLVCLVVQREMI